MHDPQVSSYIPCHAAYTTKQSRSMLHAAQQHSIRCPAGKDQPHAGNSCSWWVWEQVLKLLAITSEFQLYLDYMQSRSCPCLLVPLDSSLLNLFCGPQCQWSIVSLLRIVCCTKESGLLLVQAFPDVVRPEVTPQGLELHSPAATEERKAYRVLGSTGCIVSKGQCR